MLKRLFCLLALMTLSFLSACGGGGGGSDSSSSTSDSTDAPTITSQPASVSVVVGASATFTVTATSSTTMSYQWRKGGTAISGATSASYTISSVAATDAGSYDVVVSNTSGSVTSSVAVLTVSSSDGSPLITSQPTSQTVATGSTATLTVTATGSGTLSYQWYKDSSAISGATSASYTISSVASTDAGDYYVIVSNSAGSATSDTATLTVSTTVSSVTTQTAAVVTAAQNFINSLSTSLQSTVQLSWDLDTARHWSNLPAAMVSRNGVSWGSLSTSQKTYARTLISTALGSTGNTLHLGMQMADNYLNANGGGSSYGEGNYYIAFLGTPSTTGFWLLQLTGHHVTFNVAFNGSYASPTPLFLGVEPKGSFTYSGTTYDPMSAQRQAFANLGAALTSYSGAKLSGTYSDLLFGANGSGSIDGTCPRSYSSVTDHGLLYSSLSSTDQALAQAVIKAYVNTQSTAFSDELLSAYLSSTALAQTYVAYSGTGTVTVKNNYFRIEGPRLWIELSVQNGVIFSSDIHYHGIWRDKYADYGGKCIS